MGHLLGLYFNDLRYDLNGPALIPNVTFTLDLSRIYNIRVKLRTQYIKIIT